MAKPHPRPDRAFRLTSVALLIALLVSLLPPPRAVPFQRRDVAKAAPSHDALASGTVPTPVKSATAPNLDKLGASFVPNEGQTDPSVRYQAHALGGSLFFTQTEIVMSLNTALPQLPPNAAKRLATTGQNLPDLTVVRLRFDEMNPDSHLLTDGELPGVVNYLTGNDPARWHTNLPTYGALIYKDLYPGVDLRYDGTQGKLKGTYTLAAGVSPYRIRWRYQGAGDVRVDDATGDLKVTLPTAGTTPPVKANTLTEKAPLAWQDRAGKRVPVAARYEVTADGSVGFDLGEYDPNLPLTLDPEITYSTYSGGGANDYGYSISVDSVGHSYVTGSANSTDFPVANPLQPAKAGSTDVFVSKINTSTGEFQYSTYLGGSGADVARGIVVELGAGDVYLTGNTSSTDFPLRSAIQATLGGGTDAFVTNLNSTGSGLTYSTYLGGAGTDVGNGIALDGSAQAYVTGYTASTNFRTQSPLQPNKGGGTYDGFLTKFTMAGTGLVYSTYLGGAADDYGNGIALDTSGNAYVAGQTSSSGWSVAGAYQATPRGTDAFVTKVNAAGTGRTYATYLGGTGTEEALGIAVDGSGNAYVSGSTTSSSDFPTRSPVQAISGGLTDAFASKLNSTGSGLIYSTYLGGSGDDYGNGIALDSSNQAVVVGSTTSIDLPTRYALQAGMGGGTHDAFVTKYSGNGSAYIYSTYLGGSNADHGYGIDVRGSGTAYVTGDTSSFNFITVNPRQPDRGGSTYNYDAFVTRIEPNAAPNSADASVSTAEDAPVTATLRATDVDSTSFTFSVTSPGQGKLGPVSNPSCTTASTDVTTCTAQVAYTPNVNYNGADSFTYTATDPGGLARTATISVTVTAVNDPPVPQDVSVQTTEDSAPITVTVKATDVDGTNINFTSVGPAGHGTITGFTIRTCTTTAGLLTCTNTTSYTPSADYNGPDSFQYTVKDSSGATEQATVSVTVTAVNDPPVAAADTKSTPEDTPLTFPASDLLSNDAPGPSNESAQTLTVTAVAATTDTHGTVTLGGGNVTYTPANNYNGAASFTYTVTDSGGGTSTATATVNVSTTAVNDKPVASASPSSLSLAEDAGAQTVTLQGSDVETAAGELVLKVTSAPAHGALKLGATALALGDTFRGSPKDVTYTPDANYNGADGFGFSVTDTGDGDSAALSSDEVTVSITVAAVNDKPVATDDSEATPEDISQAIILKATDADGDDLSFSIAIGPAHGTLGAISPVDCSKDPTGKSTCSANITYDPDRDYDGSDGFTYTADDGISSNGTSAHIGITVSAVNDAPTADDGTATDARQGFAKEIILSGADVDSSGLTFELVSGPDHGTLSAITGTTCVSAGSGASCTASVSYKPIPSYAGPDSLTYRSNDGSLGSPGATVRFIVTSSLTYLYNDSGQLLAVVDPNAGTTIYSYDDAGNLVSISSQSSSEVSILDFTPSTGLTGTRVTIQGTGFNPITTENTVKFSGTAATVESASATRLVVTVPPGAATGAISVSNADGSDTSDSPFTVSP